MTRFVIIVAGGKGLRMGGDLPKQFIPLDGRPVLMHTLQAFYSWDSSLKIILVLPESHWEYWNMLCSEIGCEIPHTLVNGGETRFHSVQNGLKQVYEQALVSGQISEDVYVAVHDGVRPFVSREMLSRCFDKAMLTGAVVPVLPMIDSLREIDGQSSSRPVDRSRYLSVQTPQVFRFRELWSAYKQDYCSDFTDDASVVESQGACIQTVAGTRENIKITTPFDLLVAGAVCQSFDK